MDAVTEIERVLRSLLAPTKVNLAALGNVVPHLHWHVIARFSDDSHFPAPIWAAARREALPRVLPLAAVDAALARVFSG
jgi:diadenosine tetraphosphate (Ap4A) HIT family hydrolase